MSEDEIQPTGEANGPAQATEKKWRPLGSTDRRVIGVLIEKGLTTPDQYPLSLNALTSGCNQKSNRSPQTQLEPEDVEESLERLRGIGAAAEIFGSGRVARYRHYMYEWLGVDSVDKSEIAVMAELLLRGPQTLGELRARASRMQPIADVAELRTVVAALRKKDLIVPLTAEGRGHVLTHNLYTAGELERIKAQYGGAAPLAPSPVPVSSPAPAPVAAPAAPIGPPPAPIPADQAVSSVLHAMKEEIASLRETISRIHADLENLRGEQQDVADELRQLRDALGG